jgi:phosphatidylglycerol---prolipoprotein diacylglyceryl transferase
MGSATGFLDFARNDNQYLSAMLAYYLHSLDPIIFRIYDNVGPRWYGLAYVLAFICGYLVFLWLAKRGYADLPP